jgi:ATP-dependent metalloprotease
MGLILFVCLFLFIDKIPTLKENIFFEIGIPGGKSETKSMFEGIIGIEEYKDEVLDIVQFLRDPSVYKKIGADIPRGIMLTGPPGTGKTLLAKAIAEEAGCNFFYISGSDVDKFFVGAGAKKVREIFRKAREKTPSIIFIDEIDAMARDRSTHTAIMTDNSTLNQLLVEMDGFNKLNNVIVIGATNLIDRIDKALLRPGRFDKIISIPLPDVKGREKLFEFYTSKIKTIEPIDYKPLAERTTRLSGADIANLVNRAIINAVKNKKYGAANKDFDIVLEQHFLGIRSSKSVTDLSLKKQIAYYEAAKAVMSLVYPNAEPVFKMTILSRGDINSQVEMIQEDCHKHD